MLIGKYICFLGGKRGINYVCNLLSGGSKTVCRERTKCGKMVTIGKSEFRIRWKSFVLFLHLFHKFEISREKGEETKNGSETLFLGEV